MTIIVYYLRGAYIHTSVRTIKYESMYDRHPILLLTYRIVSCLNIWKNKMDFKIEIELNCGTLAYNMLQSQIETVFTNVDYDI